MSPMKNKTLKNKKYSILIVDDQDNWLELLTELLEGSLDEQFDVFNANSYENALNIIREQHTPFHVVVTDMRLVDNEPNNEEGLALIEYLNFRGDETKTIVVTGYPTIATAKRSFFMLNAYDYLEKHPSDGFPFDPIKFQRIVYQAAQEAEVLRPEGFNGVSQNILFLEPDMVLGLEIKDMLAKEGYKTDLIQNNQELDEQLAGGTKAYDLILLNEALFEQQTLETLKNKFPNVSIILLMSRDVESIFTAMREYSVLTAISLPVNQADVTKLRDLVHSALSIKSLKYVSMQIVSKDKQEKVNADLELGVTYECKLLIHDKPLDRATRILLLPSEQKKDKIRLDLFIFAEQMEIKPNTEIFWEISSTNERPTPCLFSITPRDMGEKKIFIEIEQNRRPLGRIAMDFLVKTL